LYKFKEFPWINKNILEKKFYYTDYNILDKKYYRIIQKK